MNSQLRLQDHTGNDIVTVDLETGEVQILRKDKLTDAAWAFWDAVSTIGLCIRNQHNMPLFKDMIIRSPNPSPLPGDIIIIAGPGTPQNQGGNILVHNP